MTKTFEEEWYKKVLDNLYDGIYFVNSSKKIVYWNKGTEEHTGYGRSEALHKCCCDILKHFNDQGENICDHDCPISKSLHSGRRHESEVFIRHKAGHLVPMTMRVAPLRDQNNQIVVAVEIFGEHSPRFELKQTLDELKRLALIDSLTGVGNRRYVEINLQGRLDELNRYGWNFGVLFIDLDHFKAINDIHGHEVGDRVLKMAGKSMTSSLRTFDMLGRWGGEEFVAILANVNKRHLKTVAERVRTLVGNSSITVGSDTISVTVSIGATIARPHDTVETLLDRADSLLYKSKNAGRNTVTIDRC